ncbi:hypothetical protein ACO0R3_002568 [Hanseniaspora guilliermondii]
MTNGSFRSSQSINEEIQQKTLLKIQINAFDHYLVNSKHEQYYQVPVIRIFGKTHTGSSIIAHIHNVYPYILIKRFHKEESNINIECKKFARFLEDMLWDFYSKKSSNSKKVDEDKIDEELNKDFDENDLDADQKDTFLVKKTTSAKAVNNSENIERSKTFKYIAKVDVIKGKEFYGYHENVETFYKISLLRPKSLNRLTELLNKLDNDQLPNFDINVQKSSKKINVFEAHLPYFLQFCIDFNLYGCSWLNVDKFQYRIPMLNQKSAAIFDDQEFEFICEKMKSNDYPRIGNTFLEIDVEKRNILNSIELTQNDLRDSKTIISSTKQVWDSLNKIRADLGLEAYQASQTNKVFPFLESTMTQERFQRHEIIQKSYDSLIQNDSQCTYKDVEFDFNNIPTLAESNIGKSTKVINNECTLRNRRLKSKEEIIDDDTRLKKRKLEAEFSSSSILENQLNKFVIPTYKNVEESLEDLGLKKIEYDTPFYSDATHYSKYHTTSKNNLKSKTSNPELMKKFKVKTTDFKSKQNLRFKDETVFNDDIVYQKSADKHCIQYAISAPTYNEIYEDIKNASFLQHSIYGTFFETGSQNLLPKKWKFKHKTSKNQYNMHNKEDIEKGLHLPLSNMFMELILSTDGDGKVPNPESNPVLAICWSFEDGNLGSLEKNKGFFVNLKESSEGSKKFINLMSTHDSRSHEIVFYENEMEMIVKFCEFFSIIDPDILTGFEVHNNSWGYLINRGDFHGIETSNYLSRVNENQLNKMRDTWGYTHASSIKITGRHMLNLWRTLKNESRLESFSLENFSYHLLHKRIPKFSNDYIFQCWKDQKYSLVIDYIILKIHVCIEMVDSLNIIPKIAEQARITGVDFYSVIYRGSQFKVESLLSRISRKENYIMYSPHRKDVRSQKPMECIALIMEPDSQMYVDPLVVLDFQSLYPSIMIAFNLCYSTIVGDCSLLNENSEKMLGANKNYDYQKGFLKHIGLNNLFHTINGDLFVTENKRKGILGKMLTNLLETRVMIKSTMSDIKRVEKSRNSGKFESLMRDLEGMQLALKFVLNVTYGYTAASHSGRMPLQELADSVVEMGRHVLTQSIHLINNSSKWGAKVVYTDTDSLFVLFPGKTRDEAFKHGREMAKVISDMNPDPIKLKFEKLYHPCILVTKKRYVGNMFETEDDAVPVLQAKGLEIIRRDGTPLLQKLMETSVKILFDTKNISIVQNFITKEFEKLYRGRYLVQDLCFSRKVKMGYYKRENSLPPAAYLAKELMDEDESADVQYKQTVRYVVVRSKNKNALLREKATTPIDFMKNRKSNNLQLDMEYYIMKHLIPPLNRIFNLIGIDCEPWFNEVKEQFIDEYNTSFTDLKSLSALIPKVTKKYCENCLEVRILATMKICHKCLKKYEVYLNHEKDTIKKELVKDALNKVCAKCIGYKNKTAVGSCVSEDCPIYYQREYDL